MANFTILQEIKGEWRSTKTVEIMGLRIPAYFTDDPQLLYDYIVNFKTKSDDVFVVSYPKAGQFVKIIFYLTDSPRVREKNVHFCFRRDSVHRSIDCFEIWASFELPRVRKSGFRIPECRKFLLVESGMPGFGMRNTSQGIRNPTNDWNWVQNPRIHGVESRIQDCLGFPKMGRFECYILSLKGTTWVQEIVWQIYHNGEVNSKRIEDRVPFLEEATNSKASQPDITSLPSPRLIKTHLSYEAIPKGVNEETTCKYIYVARNPKDNAVSNYKFLTSLGKNTGLNASWEFYANLFVQGKSTWSHWDKHVLGWWKHRDDANVLFLKYEDLKKDLLSHVRMISQFLNKPLSDELLNRITEQCTFNGMMKNAKSYVLRGTEDGPKLLRKGVVGDWENYFTPEQSERFDKELLAKLDGTGLEFEM
ncbi:unnamed protein product [Porites lobata]|uniref:Sulfotransferase domain-containing protein n=1 Tax=Porites lobata TaxID=104759 RepID=A0ABN8RR45_9CNID|nr:unnamed protein product [Porites lobata]